MADLKSIEDMMRDGLLKKGTDESLKVKFLSTGIPALDTLLGGGIPIGRALEAYGPESTGKTLIAQYVAAAVQQSEFPKVLYMDHENTFDEEWWQKSKVDTDALMVSKPATAEAGIDVMRAVLLGEPKLGLIIVDSIAAMTPNPEMDDNKSSEDNQQPGLQARAVTRMYRQCFPLLDNRVIFFTLNQMRESIGMHDELGALPGGRAQRHYNHIILRTRRDEWIKDSHGARIGFYMEITQRKNKLSTNGDGTSITLPFLFDSQIDMLTSFINDAIEKRLITRRGPYYYWDEKAYLGMGALRNFFIENEDQRTILEGSLLVSS